MVILNYLHLESKEDDIDIEQIFVANTYKEALEYLVQALNDDQIDTENMLLDIAVTN